MLTHALWALATIVVAFLVYRDTNRGFLVERTTWQSTVEILKQQFLQAHEDRDKWKSQSSMWSNLYHKERDEYMRFVAAVTAERIAMGKLPDDVDIGDPPTVNEADRAEMEARRAAAEREAEKREAADFADREPVMVNDDETPPVHRLTAEDDADQR